MNVAHFVQRYPPALGGSEAYFARLSRWLVARGQSVTVFTTTALDLEAFWSARGRCLSPGVACEAGVEVCRHSLWRWPGRRLLLKGLSLLPVPSWQRLTLPCNPIAPNMWRAAGRPTRPYDLVHATAFPYAWPMVCGLRLARTLGIPFLVTPFLHLGDPEDPTDRTRRGYLAPALLSLLREADRIFVQTELERMALLQRGFSADRVVLQGLGVEPSECTGGDRERTRRSWGVGPTEVVVGHLANNSEEKGTADLLRATEHLWGMGRSFHVVLAGPEMANFRRFLGHYAEASRVLRLGPLDDRQRRDFFAGIDVFALPSRSDSFGLVLLEAWANGVPNLAYRAGGVAGVIRHEADGLLVRCGDVKALAEALAQLVDSPSLRSRMGTAGRQRVQEQFRWEDKLQRVFHVYREVARPPAVRAA
jgi:glycosyltransferase involved in cell wall biosynthesis